MSENRRRLSGRVRGRAALAIATAALLAGAATVAGAAPVPAGPADPATAAHLAPRWTSHFGSGKYQASPVVAGQYVYIGDQNGYLTKLPLATGSTTAAPRFTPVWSTNECFNGIFSKPAVGNGRVFVSTIAGYVCAFDDSGALVWRQSMPAGGWATSPVLVGDTLYASDIYGGVAAFDAYSGAGTPRWSVDVGGPDSMRLTGVTVLGGKVYAGTSDGRVLGVTPPATAGAPATVTELAPFPGGHIDDVLATDGTNLYASVNHTTAPSVGEVHVVALNTNGDVLWNVNTQLDPTYYGYGPTVAGGIVYAPTKTKLVYLDAARKGARVATADTSPNQPTTPAVVNGVAYVGGIGASGEKRGALQAFDATTGVPLYYSHTPTVANTSPAVAADGTVLLGGGNGSGGQADGVLWAYQPVTAPEYG